MPLALTAIGKNQIVIAHISATTSIAKHLPFNIRMSSVPQFALLASLAYHWHHHVLDGAGVYPRGLRRPQPFWKAIKKGAHHHKWAQGHGQRMAGYELDDYVVEGHRRPINVRSSTSIVPIPNYIPTIEQQESIEDGSHEPEAPAAPAEP
ncbi:hypothetical protein PG990_002538 [Apiospora arundinis]